MINCIRIMGLFFISIGKSQFSGGCFTKIGATTTCRTSSLMNAVGHTRSLFICLVGLENSDVCDAHLSLTLCEWTHLIHGEKSRPSIPTI